MVQDSFIAEYVTCSLAMSDNLPALALVLVITVVIALASSLYPAWYITSFNASLAVKSGFAGSAAGRRMRLILTGVQFIISITLIIVSAAFWMQYRYMMRFDMGFDRDNLLTFESTGTIAGRGNAFLSYLESDPDIAAVTTASVDVIGLENTKSWWVDDLFMEVRNCDVRYNFFDVMGIPLIDGEGFSPSDENRNRGVVVNRYLAETLDLHVGDLFTLGRVAGITDDVMMHDVSQNKQFMAWGCATDNMRFFYVRVHGGSDIRRVCDFIRKAVHQFDPAADEPSIEFVDQHVARLYDKVKRQTVLVSLFALLSVPRDRRAPRLRRLDLGYHLDAQPTLCPHRGRMFRRGRTRGVVCRRPLDGALRKPYRHLVAHIPRCSAAGAGHNAGAGDAAQLARRQREPLARTGRRVT